MSQDNKMTFMRPNLSRNEPMPLKMNVTFYNDKNFKNTKQTDDQTTLIVLQQQP